MEMLESTGSVRCRLYTASETAGEGVGKSTEHTQPRKKWSVNPAEDASPSGERRSHTHID